ncbi:MAG: hypothetical protein GTN38_04055 [Candidatus Aenigmarchaeota archaeon]|nr:hypothetical protein [Candidatus Aenigmarchaeota archaeon]NIP40834.1 hypothetical protein [Candidatus Aenigmarchaeota archaeon]NIQ17948.1 hypothetical protein [Candidatus Aenigmarchaeota archaeon]NIS73537.1 hypothetical protein [Candidatus Aenigmarchaeota archaeon]
MNSKILLFSLVVFILLACPVRSQNLEYYGIETRLDREMAAANTISLIFDSEVGHFDYRVKYEVHNLEVENKYGTAECETKMERELTVISCDVVNTEEMNKTQVQLDFETRENVDKIGEDYEFDSLYLVDVPVERAFSIVYLPETATLKTKVPSESFTPRYGNTLSDGKHIMVYWEREDVKVGDDLEFSVSYIMPAAAGSLYDVAIIVIIAVVLITVIAVGYVKRTHRESSVKVVMPLMKGDEKRIIDILAERKGQAIQRVLVRESDFSKAKVSRLVASLKERGIVDVEHLGRTNRITLKLKR